MKYHYIDLDKIQKKVTEKNPSPQVGYHYRLVLRKLFLRFCKELCGGKLPGQGTEGERKPCAIVGVAPPKPMLPLIAIVTVSMGD